MMTQQQRLDWIKKASYEELLRLWRFEPVGSPWFSDEVVSEAFEESLKEKKAALGDGMAASVSKVVGWGRV